MRPAAPFWIPTPEVIAAAQVTRLVGQSGVRDFDALCELGRLHPDQYWRTMNEALGIVWSKAYEAYADLSAGAPFPRWFPGGELNWVDTVFAHEPGRLAVIAENEAGDVQRVTYAELQARVGAFARGLHDLGLRRGDRIGLLLEMGVEAVVSVLAASSLGAIAAPLFSGFGTEAIVARLRSAGACMLIATSGFQRRGRWVDIASTVAAARPQLPALRRVIIKGSATVPEDAVRWEDVPVPGAAFPPARMDPNDPMMVIYTSGTTGKPKGAVHVHGGFPLKIAHDAAVHFDIGAGDVFFWPADLGWVAGTLTIASALTRGATLVCYDGAPDAPDWSRMSRVAAAHGVTHLGASPTLIRGLAAHPGDAILGRPGRLRVLITAGEVIDPEHMVWFANAFGPTLPVINYTGGTEVSGGLLGNVVVRPIVAGAFNAISPGIDADVLDEAGRPVRDQVGELAIRAPFVGMTQSFWNDRERYLESYWQQIPGVWVHGDLVLRTADDVLFVLGRSDDTLKVAGKRVGPAEIEDLLLGMPGIAEAAAIGIPDAVKGQSLVVFVVPSAACTLEDEALESAVSAAIGEQLGRPFRPGRVHVVPQLPRTRSAKVMRRVIRRAYVGDDPGDLSSLEDPAAVELVRAAARQAAPS